MKIFIIGLPESGRTTVAKALCQTHNLKHIHAASWIKSTFRDQRSDERSEPYLDEYHSWFTNRLKNNPNIILDHVNASMAGYSDKESNFMIDGIFSPKDFTQLFDYNEDIVIFLNRTNNNAEYKDYENIGVSVIKDYCFWLSSANLLPRNRWMEYNFQIPAEDSEFIKVLGSKNSVFIVKSINNVINHLKEQLLLIAR